MEFHWADYVVLVAFLVISAAIGFCVALRKDRQRTTTDYLLGGRNLNLFPVAISIWVTLMSAVSVLGTPLQIYLFGISFYLLAFSFLLSVPIVAHVFVPFFYRLQLPSIYEYLELRFNKVIRLLGSIVFCLQMVLYMAVGLYAPSLALSQVAGLSMWISILGVGVVCTLYTALGGLRAVVYTDTFQAVIIMAGSLALIVKAIVDVGGVDEVWRIAEEGRRLDNFLDFDPDPRTRHTVWGLIIGGAVTTISLYGINQTIVQRYLAVQKLQHAQATVYINLPATFLSITLFVVLGLVAYARYHLCDPLVTGRIQAFDQLIPLMVMEVLGKYPGLPGLFVACVFSASLSTVSSGVNALALVCLEDVVKPTYITVRNTPLTENQALVVTKILAAVFGLLTVGLAYLTGLMNQTLVTITIKAQGMMGGPLLGLFILAMFFPCTNSWGAGVGLLCGLAFSLWLGVGAILHGPRPPILPLTPINCSVPVTSPVTTDNVTFPLVTSTMATSTFTFTESSSLFNSTTSSSQSSSSSSGYDGLALYELSYLWYGVVSALVAVLTGLVTSILTGCGKEKAVNPDHIIPVWQILKRCVAGQKTRFNAWKSPKSEKYNVNVDMTKGTNENNLIHPEDN